MCILSNIMLAQQTLFLLIHLPPTPNIKKKLYMISREMQLKIILGWLL